MLKLFIYSRWFDLLVGALLVGAFGAVIAQAPATPSAKVEAPLIQVGDQWTYQHTDFLVAGNSETRVQIATAVGPQGTVLKSRGSVKGETERSFNADWHLVSQLQADGSTRTYLPASPEFKFPLEPGLLWKANTGYKLPNGTTLQTEGDYKVVRTESITAGGQAWDAVVIEGKGNFTAGRRYGHFESRRWYAPAARNVVKAEFTVRSGADMVERNLTELVSLQLKN